jgi:tripartite-type tricarboxylate transporter receptor subunit TctC
MNEHKRSFLKTALGGIAVCAAAPIQARDYPDHAIRVLVPWPAGGNADMLARIIGAKMGEILGTSLVIDDKPGAGGNIGMGLAAQAAPDGYTIAEVISANAINETLYRDLPFNLMKSFTPIGLAAGMPLILVVHPSLPVNSVAELIAYAKAHPGQLNYASGGNGTGGHLAAELFKTMTGTQITHVPYKGATPAVTDLIAGRVQLFFDGVPSSLPHVRAGELRLLATTTAQRFSGLPDVPTIAESGVPGYDVNLWLGFLAPVRTDSVIIDKLNQALQKAIAVPDVRKRIIDAGFEPRTSTPQQFGAYMGEEIAKWAKVIQASGARID